MKADTRRAVAYIAARAITGADASSVYDFDAGKHTLFSGDVAAHEVSVYDFDAKCHIGGELSSLYHFGHKKHIQLTLEGTSFSGFDFDDSRHFSGDVNGSSISLYDHATSKH
jgi:hypothetical protein